METHIFADDWFTNGRVAEPEARILLADQDPISRHVLGGVVHRADRLTLVASVDIRQPLAQWPLDRVDVAVLGMGYNCEPADTVRELVAHHVAVLLIGVGWTKEKLDTVLEAGAKGCLLKDTRIGGLAAATRAVASGHTVLSPELDAMYRSPAARRPARRPAEAPPKADADPAQQMLGVLTEREREVLGLLTDGLSTVEAADRLQVSSATIKSHISHTLTKLGVRNRLEAVLLMRGTGTPKPQHTPRGRPGEVRTSREPAPGRGPSRPGPALAGTQGLS